MESRAEPTSLTFPLEVIRGRGQISRDEPLEEKGSGINCHIRSNDVSP